MPFWDDEDFGPYESGGITGGQDWRNDPNYQNGGYAGPPPANVPEQNAPAGSAPQATQPAFDPYAQVGHNDVFNGMNREQYRDAWLGSGVKDIAGMKEWTAKNGGRVISDNGTMVTPFGETMDNLIAARTGNGHAGWGGGGPSEPAPMQANGGGLQASMASSGGNYGGGGGSQGLNLGQFDPFVYEKWQAPDAFKAPSAQDAQNDPGYQFGLDQGTSAMTNSAAARGLLRSGGTLQDFAKFGNDYASTKYNDVYNRALQTYGTNTGTSFQANQANNQGRLGAFGANTNAALGYGNLNLGYQNSNNAYSLGQGQLALGNKSADQNYSLGQGNLALGYQNSNNANSLGWANFGLNQQGQTFNQGYSLADLGLRASGQMGGYASQYGQNGANNATGAGNANAAGQVGSANAWTQGLQNAGQAGLNAYGMYQYGQRGK